MDQHIHTDRPPHVVIIGGGFAGLSCARKLGGSPIRVSLVDRRNYHLFVPLLYQVSTAALAPTDIVKPLRQIVARYDNVEVLLSEVVGIDSRARTVRLAEDRQLSYDCLVVATGSAHSYFGHPEWEPFAPGLKTLEDAREIRGRLLVAFERAEMNPDPAEQQRLMTTVIVGGGPTGVELAGAVADLTRHAFRDEFRHIDPRGARTILVEAGPRLLAELPESLSDYARRALERLGVTIRLNSPVENVSETGITVGDAFIPAGTIAWGAGVAASPVGALLGAEMDKKGRVKVTPELAVRGLEGVYVLGDLAQAQGADGRPLPGLAQVAKQQGEYLGAALKTRLLAHRTPPPFRFHDRGNLATIGRNAAVADFGRVHLTGFVAFLVWSLVHVFLLVGFRNRTLVAMQWLITYVTNQRGARLITDERKARR